MNLLSFYLAHPFVAIAGSVLLLYCPPLLDILPMYVTFLFFTPIVLSAATKLGWRWILAASCTVWLLAQFGVRDLVHNWIVHITHLPIPLQESGAFNLFAWQAIWTVGMWLGARSAVGSTPLDKIPGWVAAVSGAVCVFFIGVRFGWFGPYLTPQTLSVNLDKWQIGPLRVLNLIAFTIFAYWMRRHVLRVIAIEPFLTLGKASLHVFCAHIVFVFAGLTMLYGDLNSDGLDQLHGIPAIALLTCTFASLLWLASNEVRKKRAEKEKRKAKELLAHQRAEPPAELARTGT
jgi:hypothetical protein